MPINPSADNPRGLTGVAYTNWRRSQDRQQTEQGRDSPADTAAEPAASGDAAEVSHDGGDDADQHRPNSASDRREALLRGELQEALDDFSTSATQLDNLLQACR